MVDFSAAMLAGIIPTVGGAPGGGKPSTDLAAALQSQLDKVLASDASGATSNTPLVPLWKATPASPKKRRVSGVSDSWDTRGGHATPTVDTTADDAASAFLDMADSDKQEFARKAIAAGLINTSGGVSASDVFSAWQKAVGAAASYNQNKSDPTDMLSPWQAVDRLGLSDATGDGGFFDGLQSQNADSTQTQFQKFDQNNAQGRINDVLQQTLGRDPTEGETKQLLATLNAMAGKNPIQTMTHTDANGNVTQTQSGGFDAEQAIRDQVEQTPGYENVQAATTYMNALLSAINSPVSGV